MTNVLPVLLRGRTFYRAVDDLNVYASAGAGVVEGRHITTGRIEFTGYNYSPTNPEAVPLASAANYDHGDAISTGGTYGSMQIHNIAVPQTILAYNRWGSNEIEDVVAMHPGVLEAAAIGIPDEKCGEAVRLVVVRTDATLTEEALRAHCRQHLTGYKQPRVIEFRASLPTAAVGKVLRRELR